MPRLLTTIFLLLIFSQSLWGQDKIKGVVLDSISNTPILGALISIQNGDKVVTDNDGVFVARAPHQSLLKISSVGYQPKQIVVMSDFLTIHLSRQNTILETVEVVTKKKSRYRRRGNPAVELIQKVMAAKAVNRAGEIPPMSKYQKRTLYGTEVPKNSLIRKGSAKHLMNNNDQSVFTGLPVFPLSLREQLYVVKGNKKEELVDSFFVGFEEAFEDGTSEIFLSQILKESDIYDNTIGILLNEFVSPTDPLFAIANYHYYLGDTVVINGNRCATLSFTPATQKSRGFTGTLYINLTDYAVQRSEIEIVLTQNVNFVDRLRLIHEYEQLPSGRWMKNREEIFATFKFHDLFSKIYTHQAIAYALLPSDDYTPSLIRDRRLPLTRAEGELPTTLKTTRQQLGFKIFEEGMKLFTTGMFPIWKTKGGKERLEIGSIRNFFGTNPIEGQRIRLSLSTTAHLHPRIFLEGYGAYGTRDRQWKYSGTVRYSFIPKENYPMEYPRHDLSFTTEYDLFPLGVSPGIKDDLITMIGTSGFSTRSYQRRHQITYTHDRESGWGITAQWRYVQDRPAGSLVYQQIKDGGWLQSIPDITTTLLSGEITYSPGITGYKTRSGRKSALQRTNDHITVSLRHEYAYPSKWFGSTHTFHQTTLSLYQRTQLSLLGELDWRAEFAKVWGQVPFPFLSSPNISPIKIEKNSFHLLRPFEFVTDQHVALHATYNMRGLLLNHIPFIRHLELREMISVHALYGWLSNKNNPSIPNEGLFVLPQGVSPLNQTPYIEMSVGVGNILQLFRLDYFFRLTHRDHPNAQLRGLRFGIGFAF